MAKSSQKKATNQVTEDVATETQVISKLSKRKISLMAIGIFLLIFGAYLTISMLSYFKSWQVDQHAVINIENGAWAFLNNTEEPIVNWGGRLGALLAHKLIYEGVGIAGIAIGLGILLIGLSILYGTRFHKITRIIRWTCAILLIMAPVLGYLLPNSSFPIAGAWGQTVIDYLNGMVGRLGTGLSIAGGLLFIAIILFQLDIRPYLRRAKRAVEGAGQTVINSIQKNTTSSDVNALPLEDQMHTQATTEIITIAEQQKPENSLASDHLQPILINDEPQAFNDDITLDIITPTTSNTESESLTNINTDFTPVNELELPDEDIIPEDLLDHSSGHKSAEEPVSVIEQIKKQIQQETTSEDNTTPVAEALDGLSFEVKTTVDKEPTKIPHGAHVSIEDNEPYDPENDLPDYQFPTINLLEDRQSESIALDKEELEKNKNQIIQTLKSFGIEIQKISATVGPTVTLYEIIPAEGVRISKIRNLEDDIALSLAALGIRIIAPIPGKGTIGIEVPNAKKQIVNMRTLISSEKFVNSKMSLPIALGKKIDNENYIVDLATMPHLLMAGATGQGKSVGINTILVSLLYKKHPSQLKFVLVDPKKVELSIYRTIEKHFLAKLPNEEEAIITDTKKVIYTLNALCIEMDNRYELLKEAGTRNIKEYNEKFVKRRLNPAKGHKYLPFIVLVVDEFADLIMTAGKEVEVPIARLAQLARAVGIHLIIATQRPSVNVITGTIKANFPGRIAFKVSAKVDSRTILDTGGAEQLVGKGDLLVSHGSELLRLQCAFVDTEEVERVVEFIGSQRGYPSAFELPEYEGEETEDKQVDLTNRDKLFEECARLVVSSGNGSTSNLQRRFNLGYNRAGRIMDQLEAAGIVGPAQGSKPRDILIKTDMELNEFLSTLL